MERRGLLLGFAFFITALSSAKAETVFHGQVLVTAKAGACSKYDPTGQTLTVRYRPAGLPGNGADSSMGWFGPVYAQSFALTGQFGKTARQVFYNSLYTTVGTPTFPVKVAFATVSPLVPTSATKFVEVEGSVENYDFMAGCTIKFRMALTLLGG